MSSDNTQNNAQDKWQQERQLLKNAMKHAKEQLDERITEYLASIPSINTNNKIKEFEIRFGKFSKNGRIISKIDYNNIVNAISSAGFHCKNKEGLQILRIYSQYQDARTNQIKTSNIRAEIVGSDMISQYCTTNNIEKLLQMPNHELNKMKFTQKTSPTDKNGKYYSPIDFPDMGFRVDYKYEQDYGMRSGIAQKITEKWQDNKKKFRMINRVRFEHDVWPIFVDLSIVKSSKQINEKVDVFTYTIQESEVFKNAEKYEVELEIDNLRIGLAQKDDVMDALRKVIRVVMSGIQGSNYPIPLSERDDVLQEYLRLSHGEEYKRRNVSPNDFIGPSSYTLQMENIVEINKDSKTPNIRKDYTVTDKADGERKLLFVNKDSRIYMIDMNMNVQFTGTIVGNKKYEKTLANSIIDGEHIKFNKKGEYIHLFKAFDIYFAAGKNTTEFPLVLDASSEITDGKPKPNVSRLDILSQFIERLTPISLFPENKELAFSNTLAKVPAFRVECKQFYIGSTVSSIFSGCSQIMSNIRDHVYEYETDGLIFTPAYAPVGSIAAGIDGPLHKYTWDLSFKWKPAEFNTVDFLVSVEKDKTGAKDKISYLHQQGNIMDSTLSIVQYKTLRLFCGYSAKKHAIENAFNDILHERLPNPEDVDNENDYSPRIFEPTDPYDPMGSICNIIVKEGGERDERALILTTEMGEYFEEYMIVEFRYDKNAEPGWNWKPIRVRHDKTQRALRGLPEYGNAFHVANSNWRSIHNEITSEIISTGYGIPESVSAGLDADLYYNGNVDDSRTVGMRNFHNLFVKKRLILGVSNAGDTLLDYAVGKAGDLPKWRQSKLSMVMGIDLSRDNISGAVNSACVRYIQDCAKYSNIPYCLFLKGNSSLNIRSGEAFPGDKTSKERMVADAVFGKGPKDPVLLGKGVYKRYGIAENGFHVSSCQFAIHYFFENPVTLHSFMRNLAECTRLQGHFICTSYDGMTLYRLLKNKKEDEGVEFVTEDRYGNKRKICSIIKKYSQDGYAEDETSVGYPIHVFQETIHKTSLEYLVSFKYLTRIMENYGFELIRDEEAQQMGLPHSSGMFDELYAQMEQEIAQDKNKKNNYKQASNMSAAEKQISFLNRYCVFRKARHVSKETMDQFAKMAKQEYNKEERFEISELDALFEKNEREKSPVSGVVKKIKVRVYLKKKPEKNVDMDTVLALDDVAPAAATPSQEPTTGEEKDKEKDDSSSVKFTGKKIRFSKK